MTETHTGRCLCRATTYSFETPIKWCLHCHCESCRRNCSAPFTTFVSVLDGQWRWTGTEPRVFESSPGVQRFFCGTCGSPAAYRPKEGGENHFYLAALDDPEAFAPTRHVFHEEKLAWVHLSDDLPRFETV